MATITKTITENSGSAPTKSAWTLTYTHADVVVSNSTFTFGPPTMTAKYVNSARAYANVTSNVFLDNTYPRAGTYDYYTFVQNSVAWASGVTKTITLASSEQRTYNTSDFFSSSNATSNIVPIYLIDRSTWGESNQENTLYGEFNFGFGDKDWGTLFNVVLNAPPTFSATALSKNTSGYYPNLTTVSTTISGATAQYGGTIASSSLTIGNQTVSGGGNGTLSITLNAAGTFTPVVSVTDSRGQVATQSLTPITVAYSPPSASVLVERINNSTFLPDEEGTNALITASFSYMDDVTTLKQPTVSVTDSNGTTVSATVTWYSSYSRSTGFSNAVTWPVTTASPTLYAKVVGTLATTDTYTISLTPKDGNDVTGSMISQAVGQAFFTVDFLAGGHGISFGQAATQTGFQCAMVAMFIDDVAISGDLTASGDSTFTTGDTEIENPYFSLNTSASPGTTDGDLYAAIVALGWDSDVIE